MSLIELLTIKKWAALKSAISNDPKCVKVAIKRFNDLKPQQVSYEVRQLFFINEILLLDQLSHPSLIKMLGYCVRNGRHKNTLTAPTDLDITAVFEYGEPFSVRNMSVSVEQRLQHSIDLSSLLEYMSNTHLGSLLMADFKAVDHHSFSLCCVLSCYQYKLQSYIHTPGHSLVLVLLNDLWMCHMSGYIISRTTAPTFDRSFKFAGIYVEHTFGIITNG
jgi:serine/threonine protein kinase